MDEIINLIRNYAEKNGAKDDIHGFPHVLRVYRLCEKMGTELNANMLVLKIATLLHDIGRAHEKNDDKKRDHAEISASLAQEVFEPFNISESDKNKILHCIRAHSFSKKIEPQSLEAKILSDCDKLDAIGAIGIYRTIGYTVKNRGDLNDVLEHINEKILKLKDQMNLEISKIIAVERHNIVVNFYNNIISEAF